MKKNQVIIGVVTLVLLAIIGTYFATTAVINSKNSDFNKLESINLSSSSVMSNSSTSKIENSLLIDQKTSNYTSQKTETSKTVENKTQEVKNSNGGIFGNMSYPAGGLPGVNVCAQFLDNSLQVKCTDRQYGMDTKYELGLPEGKYAIYSTYDDSNSIKKNYKAFFIDPKTSQNAIVVIESDTKINISDFDRSFGLGNIQDINRLKLVKYPKPDSLLGLDIFRSAGAKFVMVDEVNGKSYYFEDNGSFIEPKDGEVLYFTGKIAIPREYEGGSIIAINGKLEQ
jgi:hypothetical protein